LVTVSTKHSLLVKTLIQQDVSDWGNTAKLAFNDDIEDCYVICIVKWCGLGASKAPV